MATTFGWVHLTLNVAQAMNLKDKRRILKSFKDRLRNKFNVSVAEVGALESCRRAELAVAMVANDVQFVQSCLQKVVHLAERHRDMILMEQHMECM